MADHDHTGSGESVVVITNDGHRFSGRLIEIRRDSHGRDLAVIRLETGWVTTYPLSMVEPTQAVRPEKRKRGEPPSLP